MSQTKLYVYGDIKKIQIHLNLSNPEMLAIFKKFELDISQASFYRWSSDRYAKKTISEKNRQKIQPVVQWLTGLTEMNLDVRRLVINSLELDKIINENSLNVSVTKEIFNQEIDVNSIIDGHPEKKNKNSTLDADTLRMVADIGLKKDSRAQVEKEFNGYLLKYLSKIPFAEDLYCLYLFSKEVDFLRASPAIGALIYFISPVDLIPDYILVLGFLDDAGVVASAVAYLASELDPYRKIAKSKIDKIREL